MARITVLLQSAVVLTLGCLLRLASAELRGPPRISEQINGFRKAVVGRTVKLPCPVTGTPPPLIMWSKDGVTIHSGWDRFRVRTEGLKISDAVMEDAGSYVCRATNGFGSVILNYTLTITDGTTDADVDQTPARPTLEPAHDRPDSGNKIKRKPDLLGEHPVNTTVAFGGSASFQCRVHSDITPHIQWLKRIEPNANTNSNGALSRHANATIEMDGQRFVVLPAGDVLPRPDGSYLNKLMISYATAEDAGMYICLGANIMGYSFKSAFLQVLPDPNVNEVDTIPHNTPRTHQAAEGASLEQALLIGIPVAIAVLFLVAVIICVVCRNRHSRGRNHSRVPPPPQIPNPSIKKEFNSHRSLYPNGGYAHHHPHHQQGYPHGNDYYAHHAANLHTVLDIEQCAPLTSQQTLHIYPSTSSRENALNRYHDVHSPPCSFTDTLNSNGSLTSSRATANMHHHHLHQHTMLHC